MTIEIEDRSKVDEPAEEWKLNVKALIRSDTYLAESLMSLWHAYQNLHLAVIRAGEILLRNPGQVDSARYFLIPAELAFEYALINLRAATVAYNCHSGSSECEIMDGMVTLMRFQVEQSAAELDGEIKAKVDKK